MKILHVIRDLSPPTGGPVTALHGLSAHQRRSGHEVSIVSTDFGLSPTVMRADKHIELCSCTFGPWRFAPTLKGVLSKKLAWCDVVHIHMVWEYPTLLAAAMARRMGKPFLLRPCGMLDRWSMRQHWLRKRLYLFFFAKTLFSSPCRLHFTTREEQEKSPVPFSPRSVVVENGIADNEQSGCSANDFLDQFPDLKGHRLVLFLGRVHPKKRPDIAISAFARVARHFPDTILVIAGPCEHRYRQRLGRLATQAGIAERVRFTGILDGRVCSGAYRAASLFLLPSMQENFGIALVEAMAASCPVVISAYVDIKRYIEGANAGIVCATDPESVGSALHRLLSDPELAHRMGENGRAVVEKYFTWDRASERLDQIYMDLIG
jgi:glycosyltransferase involved in cell wall biosynthesis